jgi:hypothetical protein
VVGGPGGGEEESSLDVSLSFESRSLESPVDRGVLGDEDIGRYQSLG